MSRLQDRSLLHPVLRDRLSILDVRLLDAGIPMRLYEGARTPWRQAELYARGRTVPNSKKVTKAMAWRSHHQFGVAADFVFFVDGGWTWSEPEPGQWLGYQELAKAVGLDLLSFEKPHVQLPWSIDDLRRGLYPIGGDATWRAWLGAQLEQWGTFEKDVGGVFHPGAPPSFDLGERPAIEAA